MRAALYHLQPGRRPTARRMMAALPEKAWHAIPCRVLKSRASPLDKAVYGASVFRHGRTDFCGGPAASPCGDCPLCQQKPTRRWFASTRRVGLRSPALRPYRRRQRAGGEAGGKLGARRWSPPPPMSAANFPWTHGLPDTAAPFPTWGFAKVVSAAILEEDIPFCSQFFCPPSLPEGIALPGERPGVFIGWRTKAHFARTLRLIPVRAAGRHRLPAGASPPRVVRAVQTVFAEKRAGHGGHLVASVPST